MLVSANKALRPGGDGVAAAEVRLNQSVDHECRADMDSILPCVAAMPFDRPVQIGNVECSRQRDAAVTLDPRDDIVRRGAAVGAGAMPVEFEFFAMGGHGFHDAPRGVPAIVQRRGGEARPNDHAGIEMPRLGLQPDLDGNLVFARRRQKLLDLAEGLARIRTRRLEKHLEHARSTPPIELSRRPFRHFPVLAVSPPDISRALSFNTEPLDSHAVILRWPGFNPLFRRLDAAWA